MQSQPFFESMEFKNLRVPGCFAIPLVPVLKDEIDTTYFDDFTNPKDMAIYGDIQKKELNMKKELQDTVILQSAFAGFTFQHRKPIMDI
jgi:hypothetical protein